MHQIFNCVYIFNKRPGSREIRTWAILKSMFRPIPSISHWTCWLVVAPYFWLSSRKRSWGCSAAALLDHT